MTTQSSDLESHLAKIRLQQASKQSHQKLPAQILIAMEETIQTTAPTAYFAALLSLLESFKDSEDVDLDEGSRGAAVLYLFAIVLPYIPPAVLRTHVQILFDTLCPFFFNPDQTPAPALRSLISIVASLLSSFDTALLNSTNSSKSRQIFNTILSLSVTDARPKVRKRATEAIIAILSNPPAPLMVHPWAEGVTKFVERAIQAGGGMEDEVVHLLAFVRTLLQLELLPLTSTSSLPQKILHLSSSSHNKYIPPLALGILPLLPSTFAPADILKTLLASPPKREEKELSEAWVAAFASVRIDTEGSQITVEQLLKTLLPYLSPSPSNTTASISSFLTTNTDLAKPKQIIDHLSGCLVGVDYVQRQVVPNVLDVLASHISSLESHYDSYKKEDWSALLERVSTMRIQSASSNPPIAVAADGVFKSFIRTFGVDRLLDIVPLNIEPSEMKKKGVVARAFLLPLFGAVPHHPTPLKHFIDYFVPLSERLYTLKESENETKAKVYQVLIWQIWSSLQGYVDCRTPSTKDLEVQGWTPQFSALISQVLYSQGDLRSVILKALRVVVESNKENEKNIAFLRSLAPSFLAVLFNVYSSPSASSSIQEIGTVISTWSSITKPDDLKKTTHKIISVLQSSLSVSPSAAINAKEAETVAAMIDLLLILIPYLSIDERRGLWEFFLTRVTSQGGSGLGKKGWKVLSRLVVASDGNGTVLEEMSGEEDAGSWVAEVFEKIVDIGSVGGGSEGNERDRLSLLTLLIPHAPPSTLSIIPTRLLPEVILATKDASEKTRNMAFETLVVIGTRMKEGGVIQRPKVSETEDEEMEDAQADVKEYVTMLAAGLVGGSPHMISASVRALARVVFEFQAELPHATLIDLLQTLVLFLSSPTREILKSTLGFMKIAITTFPLPVLTPNLSGIIQALLPHAKDHGNHFKLRVTHIFERMGRRFGWDVIESSLEGGDEEGVKVLKNARRRKERAKRKKQRSLENKEEQEEGAQKPKGGDGFDEVLYGSGSENDASDDESEEEDEVRKGRKKKERGGGAQLKLDDDEPMDLLEGAGAHLSGSQKGRRRKPGQDASKFKTDDNTGKLIIADEEEDEDESGIAEASHLGGGAYIESLVSTDGFTRAPTGKVKFNKDTKKRRRAEVEAMDIDADVEMEDASLPQVPAGPTKKKQKNAGEKDFRLGKEFKAKKAGGDIKKGGVDPYAYLPLAQAAKHQKMGGRKKMGITGRK